MAQYLVHLKVPIQTGYGLYVPDYQAMEAAEAEVAVEVAEASVLLVLQQIHIQNNRIKRKNQRDGTVYCRIISLGFLLFSVSGFF